MWNCKKHNTSGDKGWSCAHCGYPLGVKNLEYKDGQIKILKGIINLFVGKLFMFEIRELKG